MKKKILIVGAIVMALLCIVWGNTEESVSQRNQTTNHEVDCSQSDMASTDIISYDKKINKELIYKKIHIDQK